MHTLTRHLCYVIYVKYQTLPKPNKTDIYRRSLIPRYQSHNVLNILKYFKDEVSKDGYGGLVFRCRMFVSIIMSKSPFGETRTLDRLFAKNTLFVNRTAIILRVVPNRVVISR